MTDLGARAAVERIQKGEMKAEVYAAQLLKRYNAHKDLNAVITIDEARVLQEARAIDQARARGERLGPLSGLPFIVKDQIDVAGYPTTAGHELLKVYVPKQNATIVETMIKAGGVAFAKANCNTMVGSVGGNVTSSNIYFGFVRNPYDRARIPGGSSGGTGAAIAARIVPAGIGEDTGGSVRIPAAFCGIAGLRPSTFSPENAIAGTTRKRYPDAGISPIPGPLDTIGPMARTVADVAFLDTVITGDAVPQINLRDAASWHSACRLLGAQSGRSWRGEGESRRPFRSCATLALNYRDRSQPAPRPRATTDCWPEAASLITDLPNGSRRMRRE